MTKEKHKKEVDKLNSLEYQLAILIGKTENTDLMNKFTEWQKQRIVCNDGFNSYISSLLNLNK
jgi:hypothetical protein